VLMASLSFSGPLGNRQLGRMGKNSSYWSIKIAENDSRGALEVLGKRACSNMEGEK